MSLTREQLDAIERKYTPPPGACQVAWGVYESDACEIRELVAMARLVPRWISVGERLPRSEGEVLTLWHDGGIAIMDYFPSTPPRFAYNQGDDLWDVSGPDFIVANNRLVSWMPLPPRRTL